MNDYHFSGVGFTPIYPVDRPMANYHVLTTAQAIRRLAYSAAQLPLLAKFHDFPLPVEVSPLLIGWKAQEVEAWKHRRDSELLANLV